MEKTPGVQASEKYRANWGLSLQLATQSGPRGEVYLQCADI